MGAPSAATLAATPLKRGGVLEFAVLVEPRNYDCYGNTSIALLHPIAPHYSTLRNLALYPKIVGDLAQSRTISADRQTYPFSACTRLYIPGSQRRAVVKQNVWPQRETSR